MVAVKRKTKLPTLDVDTKVKNEFTDTPMHFNGLYGGVLTAVPAIRDARKKNKSAVCVRIDDECTAFGFYNQGVKFVLFSEDERTCRFQCEGRYVVFACRIIRDADDLPEAIAAAAADLWKAE